MEQVALWAFFLMDVVGVLWCLRVLVREARKHLSWYLVGRHEARRLLELEEQAVGAAAGHLLLPRQRAEQHGPARAGGSPPVR